MVEVLEDQQSKKDVTFEGKLLWTESQKEMEINCVVEKYSNLLKAIK